MLKCARTGCLAAVLVVVPTLAGDWTNSGGNGGRNGQTSELGPDAADLLWSVGRTSIIAWQPVTAGRRVFVVRQNSFIPNNVPNDSPVVCVNLDTGAEEWVRHIPYNSGDWTAWIAGVSNGKVYAGRSGNGASVSAKLHALNQATGATEWVSTDTVDAGPYDGVVFADNGDLVVASFRAIKRIRAADGTTAWTANRLGSVSGNCGGALHGGAIYVADAVAGGNAIKKYDLATGAFLYQSPTLAGFTIQNTPMVSPDGTVYLSRVQNNAGVDFFYAINDSGSAMTVRWSKPAHWTTSSEFAVSPLDSSVYMVAPGRVIERRAASDGTLVNSAAPIDIEFGSGPRMAVDSQGRLFVGNGSFGTGRMYSFNADLTPRWNVAVPNINIGGPAIGENGTLVLAGVGTNIRAYRTERCAADFDGDGFVTGIDFDLYVAAFEAGDLTADFDGDGFITGIDFDLYVAAYEAGC